MIYDSRSDTVRLHHKDKVYLSGALGVLRALSRCEPDGAAREEALEVFADYAGLLSRYEVDGTEHLKRGEREPDPPAAKQKRLDPKDDGVTPPY